MTEVLDDSEPTARGLPVTIAASLLAVAAGGLLLSSQMTLFDASDGFFSGGSENFDGNRLFGRQYRLTFFVWPILALGLSIYAAVKQSAIAISIGLGALVLTTSFGLPLLVGYVDVFGIGDGGAGGAIRSIAFGIDGVAPAIVRPVLLNVFIVVGATMMARRTSSDCAW